MAFKIDLSETYSYPIKVEIVGDKGRTKAVTFTADFKRLSQSEVEQLGKDVTSQDGEPAKLKDEDLIDEVMVGWSDISDDKDQPLDFDNAKHRSAVLDIYGVKSALVMGFFESISGAKRKN